MTKLVSQDNGCRESSDLRRWRVDDDVNGESESR